MDGSQDADTENQKIARISWDESEQNPSFFKFPVIGKFRGSRIARRIVLYNLISLSVLLVSLIGALQIGSASLLQTEERLNTVSRLVTSQLEAGQIPEFETNLELRLYNEGEFIPLETAGLSISEQSGVSVFVRSILGRGATQEAAEPAVDLNSVYQNLATSDVSFPRRQMVSVGSYENQMIVDRHEVSRGPFTGQVLLASTPLGQVDTILQAYRDRVIQVFLTSVAFAVGLSIILAYSIATPIHNLAEAAEKGQDRTDPNRFQERVVFPKFHGRPDEIGRLSLAMRDMTKDLYDQIEHNQRFAADVTHEIKNPLASINSAVQGLSYVKRDEDRTKLQDVIQDDVNRIDRLVSDISQASKLDADLVRAQRVSFDLGGLLETITGFHLVEAEQRGIKLVFKEPEPQLFYIGVEQRLAQVFSNLVSNAVSICDAGDTVTTWTFMTEENIFIMVEDTGPGIPEENIEDIFKRFYTSRSSGSSGQNSGLGLSISRQIVAAHDGKIWAENIYENEAATGPRMGARFIVSLPRA
ncbi:MAG: HAMP domain-containing sensor histidine kinase [Pseudomonadota bacterium]